MSPSAPHPDFRPALPSEGLPNGSARAVKVAGHTIALFRTGEGELVAVDNACPHEGYPLVQGHLRDCVLTCAWHNFKFDVRDGACLKGDEDLRVYPTRERDGTIEVDVVEKRGCLDGRWKSLREGTLESSPGRMARDIVRLLRAGVPARRILAEAVRIDAEHCEWGSTHTLPLAADLVSIVDAAVGLDATLPLLHAFVMAGEANERLPRRPVPAAADPGDSPLAAGTVLREAVEREDAETAQAIVRGALARGWGRAELEPWFFRLVTDHFLGFGHPHIYATKAFDLLDAVGFEHADAVLPALVLGIVGSTREDTLPPMRATMEHLHGVEAEFDRWRRQVHRSPTQEQRQRLREALLEGKPLAPLEQLTDWLATGLDPLGAVDELVCAASILLLDFDSRLDADPTVQDGWLFATHTLTYAHAIRQSLSRSDEGHLVKSLYYGAHFVHRSRRLRLPADRRFRPTATSGLTTSEVLEAVKAADDVRALEAAHAVLTTGAQVGDLQAALEAFALGDRAVLPIFTAHYIKTTRAAFEEWEALPAGSARWPVLAAVRLLASEVAESSLQTAAHEAIQLVAHGRLPRRLSS